MRTSSSWRRDASTAARSVELGAQLATRLRCLGFGGLVGLECRQQCFELAAAHAFASDPLGGLAEAALDGFDLGGGLAALTLHARQCLGSWP